MENLYIGQSYDLFWTFNLTCPSVEEYMKMMDYSKSSVITRACQWLTIGICRNCRLVSHGFQAHANQIDLKNKT